MINLKKYLNKNFFNDFSHIAFIVIGFYCMEKQEPNLFKTLFPLGIGTYAFVFWVEFFSLFNKENYLKKLIIPCFFTFLVFQIDSARLIIHSLDGFL